MSQITKGRLLEAAELRYDSDTGKLNYLARSGADSSPAPGLAAAASVSSSAISKAARGRDLVRT